jgi:hypothetical protein
LVTLQRWVKRHKLGQFVTLALAERAIRWAVNEDATAITPDDALVALGRLTYLYTTDRNGQRHAHPPRPDAHQGKILNAIGLSFPRKPTAVKLAPQAAADFAESFIFK